MSIEVAVPCYNEARTVAKVIRDFKAALPEAEIVVYDNASDDGTVAAAETAGARIVRVNRRGKGCVLQQVFQLSAADVVIVVDGDDTYEAADARALVQPIVENQADMTIGTRLHATEKEFRRMHHVGNRALTWTLNALFQTEYADILSGYRAFNRAFRQGVPLISTGFEIETELMIQAMSCGMVVREVPVRVRQRPPGSESKLSAIKDGYRILLTMIGLLRDHRPLFAFSLIGVATFALGLNLWGFGRGGRAGVLLMELSAVLFFVGFILNTVNTRMRELGSLLRRRP